MMMGKRERDVQGRLRSREADVIAIAVLMIQERIFCCVAS